jgi:hypothetical protein
MNPFQFSPVTSILTQVNKECIDLLNVNKSKVTTIASLLYYGKTNVLPTDKPLPIETVQANFNLLGSNGIKLFLSAGLIIQAIAIGDTEWTPVNPPYKYIINQDGTVTFNN